MKIKTSSLYKTAPSPPVVSPEDGAPKYPAAAPAARTRRGCCATWSCCDIVLLVLLLLVTSATVVVFVGMHVMARHHHGESYHMPPQYHPADCKVSKIIKQGEVCCGRNCTGCTPGLKTSIQQADWYKFKDEGTHPDQMDHMMEEWEEIEEYEREEWEQRREEMEREWMGRGGMEHGKDDRESDEDGREKRSASWSSVKSFTCYKIVLEGWERKEADYDMLRGSDEEWDSSEEESSEDKSDSHEDGHRRPGPHHGGKSGHHGGHHGGGRSGHHGEHRDRRQAMTPEEMERMRKEKAEHWEKMGEDWEDKTGEFQGKDKMEDANPEAGIVVLGENAEKDGVTTSMFYDSTYTMEHYQQCSYSACESKRCKDNVALEDKMKKWFEREKTGAVFHCSWAMPNDNGYTIHKSNSRFSFSCMRKMKVLILPVAVLILTLFVILMVRRCRANKTRCQASRAARAAAAAAPATAPATIDVTKLTKEQEANLPSAPKLVWMTEALPDYEKESELPPAYKSTPDLQSTVEAFKPQEEEEEKKEAPKDSEA